MLGDGNRIISQSRVAGDFLLEGDRILLKTNGKKITMPNIKNWSYKDVNLLCNLIDIECTFEGYGYVDTQSIMVNEQLTNDSKLHVVLKSDL